MSGRQIYVHNSTGDRFTLFGIAPLARLAVLQRVDYPGDVHEACYWVCPAGLFLDAFTQVTDVADEPIPFTIPGVQPRVEFTTGPTVNGPLFSDEYLATLVGRWSRQQTGGAS